MSRRTFLCALLAVAATGLVAATLGDEDLPEGTAMAQDDYSRGDGVLPLPKPEAGAPGTLMAALLSRRSHRDFRPTPLALEEAAELLFAAQGVTDARGYRTAPSAGALYPLELYLAAGRVTGLAPGVYKYIPQGGELFRCASGDPRPALAEAALAQRWMEKAPAMVAVCAVYDRVTAKYGQRGLRYTDMEAGCAGQSLALAAASMRLGTVMVGAFDDEAVWRILCAPPGERPLLLMPVGRVT